MRGLPSRPQREVAPGPARLERAATLNDCGLGAPLPGRCALGGLVAQCTTRASGISTVLGYLRPKRTLSRSDSSEPQGATSSVGAPAGGRCSSPRQLNRVRGRTSTESSWADPEGCSPWHTKPHTHRRSRRRFAKPLPTCRPSVGSARSARSARSFQSWQVDPRCNPRTAEECRPGLRSRRCPGVRRRVDFATIYRHARAHSARTERRCPATYHWQLCLAVRSRKIGPQTCEYLRSLGVDLQLEDLR